MDKNIYNSYQDSNSYSHRQKENRYFIWHPFSLISDSQNTLENALFIYKSHEIQFLLKLPFK